MLDTSTQRGECSVCQSHTGLGNAVRADLTGQNSLRVARECRPACLATELDCNQVPFRGGDHRRSNPIPLGTARNASGSHIEGRIQHDEKSLRRNPDNRLTLVVTEWMPCRIW